MAILRNDTVVKSADGQHSSAIITAANIGSHSIAPNSTYFIGTTQNVFNRASGAQTLTGVSIDGNAANITAYTINQNVGTSNTPSFAGLVSSAVTNYAFLQVTDTNNFWITPGNNNWGLYFETSAGGLLGGTGDSNRLGFVGAGNARFYVDLNNGNGWFGGSLTANTDSRAPIFYDTNNTAYYCDPASVSNLNAVTLNRSGSDGYLTLPGSVTVSNVSAAEMVIRGLSQLRFSNSTSWDWNAWAGLRYDNATTTIYLGGPAATGIFTQNATPPTVTVSFVGTNNVTSDSNFKGPIFYDSANTAYYLDPSNTGTSLNTAGAVVAGTYVYSTTYLQAGNNNIYPNGYTNTLILNAGNSAGNSWITGVSIAQGGNVGVGTSGADTNLQVVGHVHVGNQTTFENTGGWNKTIYLDGTIHARMRILGSAYASGKNSATETSIWVDNSVAPYSGLTTNAGSFTISAGFTTLTNSARSPIFYDSDNTAYYIDGASGSKLKYLQIDGDWGSSPFGSGSESFTIRSTYASFCQRQTNGNLGYWLHHIPTDGSYMLYGGRGATDGSSWDWSLRAFPNQDGSYVEFRTSARAPIFYDSDNTAYYIDPANGGFNLRGGNSNRVTFNSGDSGIIVTNAEGISSNVRLGCAWGRPGIYNGSSITIGAETTIDFVIANAVKAYIDSSSNLFSNGSVRSPIFYDSNNTAYYLDAANSGNSLLVAGNVGIGTTSPTYKIQVIGDAYITDALKNGLVETRSFSTSFTNGVANRAADIRFPNSYINGLIEIEVTSGYNNQNSVGVVKKIFSVGANPNNNIWNTTVARVVESHGAAPNNWTIGDFAWDATNSKYIIPIYHIVSTGNTLNINIRYFSEGAVSSPILPTTTLSAEYTATIPAVYQTRHYVYYNDNIGIGTTSPVAMVHVESSNSQGDNKGLIYLKSTSGTNVLKIGVDGTNNFSELRAYTPGAGDNSKLILQPYGGNVGIGTTSPSQKLHVVGTGFASTDFRAPIFYDSDNTAYYANPSGASIFNGLKLVSSGNQVSGDDYSLWIQGGNDDWGIGIDKSSANYGITYNLAASHSYAIQGRKNSTEYFRLGTDMLSHDTRLQAPIFYDSDNTAYYINPASNSIVNSLTFDSNITIYKHNDRNLLIQGGGGTDAGLLGRGSSGQFAFQVYGSGSGSYGFLDGAWAGWDIRKVVDGDLFLNDNNTYYLNPGSTTNLNNLTVAGTMTFGTLAYTTGSRRSKNSSNVNVETVTGLVSPTGPTFLEIRGFCPTTMYRTTGDRPAPYGLGFGNGAESGGIMPIGAGDNLQEIMLYGANSGPTTFTFKRQIWEGTAQDPDGSNYYGSAVFSINTGTGAVTASTDIRSPIFYDSNNTAYYIDAASTSVLNTLTLNGILTTVSSGTAINFSGQSDSIGYNATAGQGTYIKGTGTTYIYGGGVFFDGTAVRTLLHSNNYAGYSAFSGTISGTAINIAGNGAGADPYGTIAITEPAGASNYSYYGLTRQANIGAGFGLTGTNGALGLGANAFWFGTATSTAAGVMGSAYIAFNGSSLVAVGTADATQFRDRDNTAYYIDAASTSNLVGLTVANTITGSISGNAGTATTLQTARNINGTSFNGSAAITTATWGTARTITIGSTGKSVDGSGNVAWSLAEIGAAATNQTMFIGTTSVAINRASASQTLTGISIDGSSASCTGNSATTTLATKATRANGDFFIDDNYGNTVVGLYSATRLQGVFAMGNSYKLTADGTGVGTLYGLAWSHPNFGGVAANLADHGLLILQNGVFKGAWGGGSLRTPGDVRGTLFYDWDNTGYYCDPASTSNLNAITAAGNITAAQYYTGGWFRNSTNGNGLYNESTTQHFYSDSTNYWNVASSANAQGIRLRTGGHAGTVRGYFYADTANDVGLLNNGGNWRVRVVGGDYTLFDGSSIRGQIFYDSNDTNYYVDPASTSNLVGLTVANTITGSITGNAGGSSASCTGNSATATTATNAGCVTSDTGNVGDSRLQYWQTSGNTTLNPDTEWYNAIRMGHGNPVTYYSNTLAVKMTGSNLGDIYTRTTTNGTAGTWNRFWNNNNDGAGSGLDADLLDGINSASFLRSDVSATNSVDLRSPVFYDSSDTAYFLDLNSSGSLIRGRVNITGGHSNSSLRVSLAASENGASTGIATLQQWCSEPGNTWEGAGFGYNVDNNLNEAGNVPAYFFGRPNTNFGQAYMRMLSDGNWYFYNTPNGSNTRYTTMVLERTGYVLASNSIRSPIFYDSDNTAYYCDPSSTSNLVGLTVANTITGNITGNAGGSSASCSGNAATATILQTARTIGGVSFNGSANINLPGVNTAGNQNTTGTAANVTGTVAIANGGTGATTAAAARSNLGIPAAETSSNQSLSGSTTCTIDVAAANVHILALASGTTISSFTYNNRSASPLVNTILVVLKFAGTATVTWSNVVWSNGTTPTLTGVNGKADVYSLTSYKGGTTGPAWIGSVVGQNMDSTNL